MVPGTDVLEQRYWLLRSKTTHINSLTNGTAFLFPHKFPTSSQPGWGSLVIWPCKQCCDWWELNWISLSWVADRPEERNGTPASLPFFLVGYSMPCPEASLGPGLYVPKSKTSPRQLQISSCHKLRSPKGWDLCPICLRYSVSQHFSFCCCRYGSRGLQDWPAIRETSSWRMVPQASPLGMPTKTMACLTSAHKSWGTTSCCDSCFLQKRNPTSEAPCARITYLSPEALARPEVAWSAGPWPSCRRNTET